MANTVQTFGIAGVFFAERTTGNAIGWSSAASGITFGGGHEVMASANSAGLQLEGYVHRAETTLEIAGVSDATSRLEARLRGGEIVSGHDGAPSALRAVYPIGPGAGWADARLSAAWAGSALSGEGGLYAIERRAADDWRLYRIFTGKGTAGFGGALSDASEVVSSESTASAFATSPTLTGDDAVAIGDVGLLYVEEADPAQDATAHDYGSLKLPDELSVFALSRGAAAGASVGRNVVRYYIPRFQPMAFDDTKTAGEVGMFTISGTALYDADLGGTHEISFGYGI